MVDDNVISFAHQARQAWQLSCQKGANGGLIPNLHNALIALRQDHDIRDVFALDMMLRTDVMLHQPAGIETMHRIVEDTDVIALKEWFQKNGFPSMGIDTVREAITIRAEENAFHPVQQYLRSLEWDGTKRIGVWLSSYLGADFNPYTMHVGRMFLVQMVARIMRPGCQADYMLVLEGPQGILKSSACRVLGGDYFSDHLPEINASREASQHLRGKWLIEVAELHAFSKAEATKLKSFITRPTEIYLARYGRREVHEPRQCVFVGTTNEDTYLRDATGGRRFWPVKTGVAAPINLGMLADARDQLFAEAMRGFELGDPWWPDASFEREIISGEQKQRQASDIWEESIRPFVSGRTQVTTAEIAAECLVIIAGQRTNITDSRIAAILKSWGWKRKHTERGNVWVRP